MKRDIAMKYNRRIFPIYKGLSWDPLFYAAIIFLFLTQTKGIEVSQIMYAESVYAFFLLIFQIPASVVVEKIGSRKSLILGSALTTLQIGMMLFANSFTYLVIAYAFLAFGSAINGIAKYTLLYDSTNKCQGKNSFDTVNAKGSSLSYVFIAVSSILAGYLFAINPYIPMVLSCLISFLTIIIAYRFEEVEMENKQKTTIKESLENIKQGFKFIINSKRLRALFLFMCIFVGILMMISKYENSLLKDLNVEPQYFGIIFAGLTVVQCFSVYSQERIQKTFKNKTLAFLSIPVFVSFIIVGLVTTISTNSIITMIVVILAFFVQHFLRAPYWVIENKYVTNFTNTNIRAKILSASNIITGMGRMIFMFLGGLLLEYFNTSKAYIILGIASLACMAVVLKYMKSRLGLSPEEYDKNDIEYNK